MTQPNFEVSKPELILSGTDRLDTWRIQWPQRSSLCFRRDAYKEEVLRKLNGIGTGKFIHPHTYIHTCTKSHSSRENANRISSYSVCKLFKRPYDPVSTTVGKKYREFIYTINQKNNHYSFKATLFPQSLYLNDIMHLCKRVLYSLVHSKKSLLVITLRGRADLPWNSSIDSKQSTRSRFLSLNSSQKSQGAKSGA